MRRGELPAPDDDDLADKYELADELLGGRRLRLVRGEQLGPDAGRAPAGTTSATGAGDDWWGVGPGRALARRRRALVERPAPAAYAGRGSRTASAPRRPARCWGAAERYEERVLLGVRLADGLDVDELATAARDRVAGLVADGLAEPGPALGASGPRRIVLTLRGRLLADPWCARCWPEPHAGDRSRHDTPRSRREFASGAASHHDEPCTSTEGNPMSYPAPPPASPPAADSRDTASGFFNDLFDIRFTRFVALRLISVVYVLILVAVSITALAIIFAGFTQGAGYGLFTLIFAVLGWLIYVVLARVALEALAVLFRIHDDTSRTADAVSGDRGTVAGYDPAASTTQQPPATPSYGGQSYGPPSYGGTQSYGSQPYGSTPPAAPPPSTPGSTPGEPSGRSGPPWT